MKEYYMMRDLCASKGVRYVQTSKLFYGEFSCSVLIDISEPYLEFTKESKKIRAARLGLYHTREDSEKIASLAAICRRQRETLIAGHLATLHHYLPLDSQYRQSNLSLIIYLNSPEAVAQMIADHGDLIRKAVTPRDEKCVTFLRENTNKIVRPTYYYDDYPFRVEFKYRTNDEAIDNYVERQYGEEVTRYKKGAQVTEIQINSEIAMFSYGQVRVLYLKSFEDVVLTKIALSAHIANIKEVVLTKDV